DHHQPGGWRGVEQRAMRVGAERMDDQDRRGVAGDDVGEVEAQLDDGHPVVQLYQRKRDHPDDQQRQRGKIEQREDQRYLGQGDPQSVPPYLNFEFGGLGKHEQAEEEQRDRQRREQRRVPLADDHRRDENNRDRDERSGNEPRDVLGSPSSQRAGH